MDYKGMSLPSMQSIFSKSRRNIKVNVHSNLTSLSFAICHFDDKFENKHNSF